MAEGPEALTETDLRVHPATADRFDDVSVLLRPGNPDAPACWCLTYRLPSSQFNALTAAQRPVLVRELP